MELAPEWAENQETVEKYFLYLLKDGKFSLVEAAYTSI